MFFRNQRPKQEINQSDCNDNEGKVHKMRQQLEGKKITGCGLKSIGQQMLYNKIMLGEEFKEIDFAQQNIPSDIFNGVLAEEEEKNDYPHMIDQRFQNDGHKRIASRGKGRPKGEKNGRDKDKKLKEKISEENKKKGHWSNEENKKYHWFLEIYHHHFICKEMRRLDKIFKTMATFIGSREAEQCRSHHQKMEKKYNTFPNILLHLRNTHYDSEDVEAVYEDMRQNGVTQQANLIQPQKLYELSESKKIPPTPSMIKQDDRELEMNYAPREHSIQHGPLFDDILGDHYELQLDLDHLLL